MPGRLRSSFRSGNLAEDLGVLLLKGIAAVADVARPEDVGLDAIATLLRRDDDGNCYAEDSFLVQLKAHSTTSLQYQDHELAWFVGQTQPLFIGLVSLAGAEIALYPTLFVNHTVLALHAKRVTIRFGPSELSPFLRGQKWFPWKGEDDQAATVWLGAPLLRWTLSDLVNREWQIRAYQTLKRFIALEHRERELLACGQTSVLDWSTNDPKSITSEAGMSKGHPDNLAPLADRCAPCLHALVFLAYSMPPGAGKPLMLALAALASALRDAGVEIDSENWFGKLLSASLTKPDVHDASTTV